MAADPADARARSSAPPGVTDPANGVDRARRAGGAGMSPLDRAILRRHVELELAAYAGARGDAVAAWRALERAHVLAQPLLGAHLRVHLAMVGHALRTRDATEVAGQLLRLVLAPLGHATGQTPAGNTGRARVSPFAPMPVSADLAALLDGSVAPARPERARR